MSTIKIKLTKEQVELLLSMNAILPNNETYSYYRMLWVKLDRGSNIGEFYPFEKDYPKDLKRALKNDICFEQWVWDHSTAGLTEPLDFSKYDKFVDCWSITVGEKTIANPSFEQVWELYKKSTKKT